MADNLTSDFSALLRARNPVILIVSPEEVRLDRTIAEVAASNTSEVRVWDCVSGVTDITGKAIDPALQDPAAVLNFIRNSQQRMVWILHDLVSWLKDMTVCRAVRNLARTLPSFPRSEARTLVLISPTADLPPELQDHVVTIKWSLPSREEHARIFDSMISGLPPEVAKPSPEIREAAIEAAIGLTAEAAKACIAKSLVTQDRKIVPAVIAAEKKRVVSGKGLEWFEPDPRGLDAVAGLEIAKPWLMQRRLAFSERARAFGLPAPKGVFLVGVAGCGKSLLAKSIASAFEAPLLRMDPGGMQSKWVGESQQNVRANLNIADTIGKCVLWVDEIEKALAGAIGGAADGGVSADFLGTFLTWMQERKSNVFVIATANDVSKLPPELLRKGRFDELFFVDLPTLVERKSILAVTLKERKRDPGSVDLHAVAVACKDFTGAEIAALVPTALFRAFVDNERAITTADLLDAAKDTVPLAATAADKIKALREWAKGRARPASLPEVESSGVVGGRDLDLG